MNTSLSRKVAMVLAALHPADRRAMKGIIPAHDQEHIATLLPQCESLIKAFGYPAATVVLAQIASHVTSAKVEPTIDGRLPDAAIFSALHQVPDWLAEPAKKALADDRSADSVPDAVRNALARFVEQSRSDIGISVSR